MGDCKLAAPINFNRGTLARKLNSFRLNFWLDNFCNFSVIDECRSVTNGYIYLPLLNLVKGSMCNWQNVFVSSSLISSDNVYCPASAHSILLTIGNLWSTCTACICSLGKKIFSYLWIVKSLPWKLFLSCEFTLHILVNPLRYNQLGHLA